MAISGAYRQTGIKKSVCFRARSGLLDGHYDPNRAKILSKYGPGPPGDSDTRDHTMTSIYDVLQMNRQYNVDQRGKGNSQHIHQEESNGYR